MESKINFRQKISVECKLWVLILALKTRRKKNGNRQYFSEWLSEERPIMKKHLGEKKAIFKSPIQTNENILQPLVSKTTLKTSKREKIQNISQVTKL